MHRLARARRCIHTPTDDTRQLLRELLRDTAQSVAVVTAVLPDPGSASTSTPTYHGATLSSFSSIALDPFPLVAFSLRVPSRMASALNVHVTSPSNVPPPSPSSPSPAATATHPHPHPHAPDAHLIINILSAAQPHLAHRFARPDLHPHPFAEPDVRWTPSRDRLPILSGALGALSCRLVGPSMPLARLGEASGSHSLDVLSESRGRACWEANAFGAQGDVPQASATPGLASELFIARVLCVERVPPVEEDERHDGLYRLPLLYHRRRYTTVND